MIDFISANITEIGTALVAVFLLVYAIITRQWLLLRSSALSLMLAAEKLLATGQGQLKMQWVYREMWEMVPAWLKTYLTEDRLRIKLQEWYNLAKNMISE